MGDRARSLVPAATLPEVSPRGGSPPISTLLGGAILSVHSRREASEEHNERGKEEDNHRRENCPHANGVEGVAATAILVDMVLNDSKEHEICDHNYERYKPGDSRDHGGKDGTADTGSKREEEGNEGQTASDRVQDHDSREGLRGVCRIIVEARLVDLTHDPSGVVADMLRKAIVLIGLDRSNIEDTVAKGSECDGGIADIRPVRERHLQDADVSNDGRRNGGNEKKDRSSKQQEGAEMMEDSSSGHFGCVDLTY